MSAAYTEATAQTGTRLADYLELTRPRLSSMALLTVAAVVFGKKKIERQCALA